MVGFHSRGVPGVQSMQITLTPANAFCQSVDTLHQVSTRLELMDVNKDDLMRKAGDGEIDVTAENMRAMVF